MPDPLKTAMLVPAALIFGVMSDKFTVGKTAPRLKGEGKTVLPEPALAKGKPNISTLPVEAPTADTVTDEKSIDM